PSAPTRTVRRSAEPPAKAARWQPACRGLFLRRVAWLRPLSTACMDAAALDRARISGSTAVLFPAGRPQELIGGGLSGDDHLYVREQEWEAAHTVWIWPDRSPSMNFASWLARDSKLYRTLVIALALAEVLVEGGERVGIPGVMRPTGSRNVIERIAQAIV